MATRHSTAGDRPAKPYDGFPLGWHPSGYWCQRIRGKLHCFGGRHASWQEALTEYQQLRDDLHAGRKPREFSDDDLTVRYLCNAFLTDRRHRPQAGELTQVSFIDYHMTCERLVVRPAERLAINRDMSRAMTFLLVAEDMQGTQQTKGFPEELHAYKNCAEQH